MPGQRRDDSALGAILRFWPLLAAIGAAIAAGAVGIYKADQALAATASLQADQLIRDRAQWQRIGELDGTLDIMRERMATVEAHH